MEISPADSEFSELVSVIVGGSKIAAPARAVITISESEGGYDLWGLVGTKEGLGPTFRSPKVPKLSDLDESISRFAQQQQRGHTLDEQLVLEIRTSSHFDYPFDQIGVEWTNGGHVAIGSVMTLIVSPNADQRISPPNTLQAENVKWLWDTSQFHESYYHDRNLPPGANGLVLPHFSRMDEKDRRKTLQAIADSQWSAAVILRNADLSDELATWQESEDEFWANLPVQVTNIRRQAAQSSGDHWGRHLTLIWKDPKRPRIPTIESE